MRVMNVIANARQGGMPEHVLTLSRELKQRGHQVQVLSMTEGPMSSEFEQAGISSSIVPYLGHEMGKNPMLALKATRFIRDMMRDSAPDIIHTHGPRAHLLAGRAAQYPGSHALVATAHGSFRQFMVGNSGEFGWFRSRLKQFQYVRVDRHTGKLADRLIAVCEATRDDLVEVAKVPAEKVRVIHNGVSEVTVSDDDRRALRAELGLGESHKLVTCVGRVAYHKGTADLIEAAAAIGREVPEARILIVGDGPLSSSLKERVQGSGLAERVIFTGDRRDAVRIVAASDLFVLPSLSEGLALTLLEAAMTSKAMVATDVGGNNEVVRPGETGMLVQPGDRAALAGAVVELLKDDEGRREMGRAAHRLWLSEFTVERMADRTEALYRELF